jgi:hypothetical protein
MRAITRHGKRDALTRVQGAYYVASGLWPVVHMRSFESLTGPKQDHWLVRSYGVLIAAIGIVLLSSERTPALAVASSLGIATPEVWYSLVRRRLPWPYLADAVVEAGFAAAAVYDAMAAPESHRRGSTPKRAEVRADAR